MKLRLVAVATAAVAAVATGCAGDDNEPDASRQTQDAEQSEPVEDGADRTVVRIARCLRDKGWDVTVSGDDSISYQVPKDQSSRFKADQDACQEQAGYDFDELLTPEYLTESYRAKVEVADCIRDLGYEIPEPPSLQRYIDKTISDRFAPWGPLTAVAEDYGFETKREVEEACDPPTTSEIMDRVDEADEGS